MAQINMKGTGRYQDSPHADDGEQPDTAGTACSPALVVQDSYGGSCSPPHKLSDDRYVMMTGSLSSPGVNRQWLGPANIDSELSNHFTSRRGA